MFYRVNNSEIEGQHPLVRVTPVVLLKSRVVLASILSICTAMIFALLLKWSPRLYSRFLFEPVETEATCTHYRVDTQAGQQFTCAKQVLNGMNIFIFRLLKYTFDAKTRAYQPLEFESEGKVVQLIYDDRNFITRDLKFQYYGSCQLQIPVDTWYNYFFHHLTGPFNLLQYFAVAVWFAQGTVQQPILILVFTGIAICVNYLLYLRARYLLQQLANIHTKIKIKDGEGFREVSGADVVPGDIILLEEGQQMNCDCAIIKGDVMVNEATLTGESVPIPKNAVPDWNLQFNFEKLNQHCLFEGTKLVQVNTTQENLAIVIRTGFSSLRGQYFRNVLFPAPPSRRFYVQAAKFILIFALLIVIIYLANLQNYIDLGFSTRLLVLRFLDNIVWSIPPSLPIMFSICKTASLARLGQNGVMGSNADKVESAGRVDTCCFDKTGTLTTLGLKAIKMWTPTKELDVIGRYILGCCHHLMVIKGEMLGDPLEVEMVNFVGWKIEFEGHSFFSASDGEKTFEITKIFDFSSARQMMSVIATDGQKHYLFSKGSPEMVNFNSREKKDVILKEVHQYASNGFRVLGIGYRELTAAQLEMQREEIECQLDFVGIFVLENPLKPDTGDVIQTLKGSGLDIKVISGDSPLTTIYCARVANIIDLSAEVILLDYNPNTQMVVITDKGHESQHTDIVKNPAILEDIIQRPQMTAMTGKFLEFLSKYSTEKQSDSEKNEVVNTSVNQTNQIFTENNQVEFGDQRLTDILMALIAKTRVFARQKPDQKKQIVYLLQKLDRQVLMCGDGANDCSAIAQAHIGISFSESDASYTAPFSSKSTSLSCVIKVLAQGKAAIMIIIEVFQYTLAVNAVKFITIILMLMEGQTYAEFQFTFVGFITTIPLMVFLCFSAPAQQLASYIPLDDQFTYQNFIQFYNVVLWGTAGLLINYGILRNMDDRFQYSYKGELDEYIRKGTMNSVMFSCVSLYFMTYSIIIYVSKPFKRPYIYNYILTLWTIAWSIVAIVSILAPQTGKWCSMVDYRIETWYGFNWVALAVVIGTSIMAYLTQVLLKKFIPSMVKITHQPIQASA